MNTKQQKGYLAPEVEVMTIAVEQGFFGSQEQQTEDISVMKLDADWD